MNKYKILTLLFLLVSIGVESKADTKSDDPSFWLTKEGQYLYNARLIEAAKEGDTNKVTNLVRNLVKKDDIDVQDNQGRTPLHWASKNEHLEVVDVLLDNGASIDVLDNDGNSAAVLTENSEIRKKISKAAEQDRLHAQLKEAIRHDNIKKVKELVDKGANLYPRGNKFGFLPAYVRYSSTEIQAYFFSIKQNKINAKLIEAAKEGDINKVKELVTRKIKKTNIDAQDDQGRTPLQWAAINGHIEVVDVLLDNGADIGSIDNNGKVTWLLFVTNNSEIRKKISKAAEQDRLHAQLKEAIQQEDMKRIKKLVEEKGAMISARGYKLVPPGVLMNSKNHEILKYFLLREGEKAITYAKGGYERLVLPDLCRSAF